MTVTPSIGNASFLELYVHEYSGLSAPVSLDVTANGNGSSTTPSSGAATTTAANEVIFGYTLLTNTGAAGSGFTARETLGGDVSEDEFVTSTGSYSATFSQPSGGQWIALMATFRTAPASQSGFVQGQRTTGNNVNSMSAVLPSSVGAGHLLVVGVGYSDSNTNESNVAFTVTDSLGNIWTSAMSPVRRSGHGVAQIFYVSSSSGGTDTVTVTPSIGNASFLELYVHEYSGLSAPVSLDVTANGNGSSTTPSSGAATTTAANEVIFGYTLLTNTGAAGSGFTARETLGGDVSEDEFVTSTGSYSATFSQPSGGQWIALMAAFK